MTFVLHTTPSVFGKFWVHAWRSCEGLNKDHSILVNGGQTHCGMPRGAKNDFGPQST